jgi:hypothetical protein
MQSAASSLQQQQQQQQQQQHPVCFRFPTGYCWNPCLNKLCTLLFDPRCLYTTICLFRSHYTTNILTKFLDEFKNLIQQLLQQNTMVLNMLKTLVNKMK